MNEFLFGLGAGHLSAKVAKIAKANGAVLVNYTDPGCSCGHGCARDCKANRRHWFATPNRGNPHNQNTEAAVRAALSAAGIEL